VSDPLRARARVWCRFTTAYTAVQDHTLWGPWNVEVSMAKGKWQPHSFRVSALQVTTTHHQHSLDNRFHHHS
jgi:hypothetical protein